MDRLLVKNIGVLATPEGRSAKGGKAQGEIRTLRNAWVRIEGGLITGLGSHSQLLSDLKPHVAVYRPVMVSLTVP